MSPATALPNRTGDAQRARRQAALPLQDVAQALAIVDHTDAWTGTKLAFRFLVLTAARSGEVRGATWAEVDINERLWMIPGTRMKAGPVATLTPVPLAAATTRPH